MVPGVNPRRPRAGRGAGARPGASPPGAAAAPHPAGRRVVRNGAPTNDLVLSAYAASNEQVFPRVLALYQPVEKVRRALVGAKRRPGRGAGRGWPPPRD